jgi:2-C-methyl-D-erythritol 4-phosphate cytidylyltransferase
MGPFAVILPAAGRSTRFGDPKTKKIFADLDGRPVWIRSVEAFAHRDDVAQIVLAISPDDRPIFEERHEAIVSFLQLTLVDGGEHRVDSVAAGLAAAKPECRYVAVHDAARPCLEPALIDRVFLAARKDGAAVPGLPVTDTLKRAEADGRIVETVPRAGLFGVQTPQAFRRDWMEHAYAERARWPGVTDDAQLLEAAGYRCRIVEGSVYNLKITRAADLPLARALLQAMPQPRKKGLLHPFADKLGPWSDPPPHKRFEELF